MINRDVFFAAIRKNPFNGLSQSQVDGINSLLDAWEKLTYPDIRWLAYDLATTKRETASTMLPIEEYGKGRGHAYGVPSGPWHMVYDGRGDVQLTWQGNYSKATKRLRELGYISAAEDLERDPTLAMRPDLAALILFVGTAEGWFTGKKLADFISGSKCDYFNARTIVNGHDVAAEIEGYAKAFEAALVAAQKAAPAVTPVGSAIPVALPPLAAPKPAPTIPTPVQPDAPTGFWATLIAAILRWVKGA